MDKKKNIMVKVYLFFFAVLLFGVAVAAQMVNIQFFSKDKVLDSVSSKVAGYRKVEAIRGDIYAQDGSLLATSLDHYIVGFDFSSKALTDENFNKYVDALADSLHVLLPEKSADTYRSEMIAARKARSNWYKLHNEMTYPDFKKLLEFPLVELGRYKSGLVYRKRILRKKPFGKLAARTIGKSKPSGLEGSFDKYLRGEDGEQFQRKIAGGDWVSVNDENSIEPVQGSDVYSTIDIGIQEIAVEELSNRMLHHKADNGCIVVMEVKTGKVRAIANLKRDSSDNTLYEARNYAVGDCWEPGSTFKLASFMALLEDRYIDMDDKVYVGYGVAKFHDRKMKDSHLYNEKRTMTVREVFQESSNVGVAKLIEEHYGESPEKFVNRLYGFGLQQSLGVEILGEQSPRIKDPSDKTQWFGTTLPWSSIGYEVALTPLQILSYYNAVANNGKMMRPYFVEKVQRGEEIVERYNPTVLRPSLCSQETLEKLQSLLRGVVQEGTAKWPFYKASYPVSGKTGTAQINYGTRKEGDRAEYRASFVGYFPSEDPIYSCIVVITNPRENGYYGSQVAAPVFRKVSDRIFTTCENLRRPINELVVAENHQSIQQKVVAHEITPIAQELNWGYESSNTNWVEVSLEKEGVQEKQAMEIKEEEVPNLKGMTVSDALYLMENLGLKVKISGTGKVAKQSLPAGSKITRGSVIEIQLEA
jgi:cell division protein FtsI (penicillin-binding protein 3)